MSVLQSARCQLASQHQYLTGKVNSFLQVTEGLGQDFLIRITCWPPCMLQDQGGPVVLTNPAQSWFSILALPLQSLFPGGLAVGPPTDHGDWRKTSRPVDRRATLLRDLRCHITPSCVPSQLFPAVCVSMYLCAYACVCVRALRMSIHVCLCI